MTSLEYYGSNLMSFKSNEHIFIECPPLLSQISAQGRKTWFTIFKAYVCHVSQLIYVAYKS